MDSGRYVQVLLPLPIDQEFTYEVPSELRSLISEGSRVLVQFGARRVLSGLVWEILTNPPELEVKSILGILDNHPIITASQKRLWEWMSDYYLCTLGEVMKAALPAGLKLESHTHILVNENFESSEPFSEQEELAWLYLLKNPGITIEELGNILKRKNPLPIIYALSQRGAIFLEERLTDKYKPKYEIFYQLNSTRQSNEQLHATLDELSKAPKQLLAIQALIEHNQHDQSLGPFGISRKELAASYDIGQASLESLIEKGILIKKRIEVSRLKQETDEINKPKELNQEQLLVYKAIDKTDPDTVHLLHGITSSGKTEVYIHLIKKCLDEGRQALYLLPEIALTEQIITRLRAVFGDTVGVFHSKYSDSERVELWNDLLSTENKYKLVLGARSAIFLPFNQLGLIIVDEEHESSFKQQDPAPRYHARDSAVVLSKIHQAKLLMGTATPSLESYHNALNKKFMLHELKIRHGAIPLPQIIVSNTKEAYRKKKITGHLTPELLEAIDEALVNKEQIILFQNRRGYSPYLECSNCGFVPKCRDCDVSLTLHKYRNRLVCHYCGYSIPMDDLCQNCNTHALRTKGLGTEGLEDEISIIFPHAKLSRLDLETTRSRKSYSKIINDFELGKTDILIGTQMVTKGLDFSRVRVVGIINADNMLHFPDFRSFERSFQLMTQVSGRAGRREDQGLVIIQTFDPTQRIIRQVLMNDFTGMYQQELKDRYDFGYPPFTRLIRLNIKHKDPEVLNRCAYLIAKELREKWGSKILGPQPPGVARVQKLHIRHILIKSAKGPEHKAIRQDIKRLLEKLKKDKSFRSVNVQADVDPF